MVLESLFNPFTVKKKPWQMFGAGLIYSIIGLMLAYLVFRDIAGILLVFFIVLATFPMIYTTIKNEEELDVKSERELVLLKEHTKVLVFLIFLFLGITAGLLSSYIFLPQHIVDTIFSLQQSAITQVNNSVQGGITRFDIFTNILINNFKVLFFCLMFSFLYGTGAIFILTWNASVIAVAIGNFIKAEIAQVTSLVGLPTLSTYFNVATIGFFRYMTHGILEVAAYFIVGLAGGIISIALIKHNLKERKVLIDALDLIFIGIGFIFAAAVVEVYITPLLFL